MPKNLSNEEINKPLDSKEEKKLQKILKKEAPELMMRVIHQLRQQEHLQKVEKAYRQTLYKSAGDVLRDIADDLDSLEEQVENLTDELANKD